jgi:hypothetical protein
LNATGSFFGDSFRNTRSRCREWAIGYSGRNKLPRNAGSQNHRNGGIAKFYAFRGA